MNQEMILCQVCHKQAVDCHEILFNGGKRKLCIKYGIQINLCRSCHSMAHGRTGDTFQLKGFTQREIAKIFCEIIGIDYEASLLALNTRNYDFFCKQFDLIYK